MYRTVVVSVTLAAVAVLVSGAPNCTSEDVKVQGTLFASLRSELQKSNSEYISIGDFTKEIFGFGVNWSGAKLGNFSTLTLTQQSQGASASWLCTEVTSETAVDTLTVNLGFDTLALAFGALEFETPIFNFGGNNAHIELKGENLEVAVTTTTNTKAGAGSCSVALNSFKFTSWGQLNVDFGDGLINFILTKIFNNFVNGYVLNLLEEFNVADNINDIAKNYFEGIISATGQEQTVCQLIQMLSS